MTFIDIGILLFSILFLVYGFRNGLLLEIAGIVGAIVSICLSLLYPIHKFITIKNTALSYVLSFVIYYFIIYILFIIISKMFRKTPLGFIDRLLGMVFGFIKGLFIGLIIILILSFFPIKSKALSESYSMKIIKSLKPYISNIIPKPPKSKNMKI